MLYDVRCSTKKCHRVMEIKRCLDKDVASNGWYWLVCPECHQSNLVKDSGGGEPTFSADRLAHNNNINQLMRPPLTPPSFRGYPFNELPDPATTSDQLNLNDATGILNEYLARFNDPARVAGQYQQTQPINQPAATQWSYWPITVNNGTGTVGGYAAQIQVGQAGYRVTIVDEPTGGGSNVGGN